MSRDYGPFVLYEQSTPMRTYTPQDKHKRRRIKVHGKTYLVFAVTCDRIVSRELVCTKATAWRTVHLSRIKWQQPLYKCITGVHPNASSNIYSPLQLSAKYSYPLQQTCDTWFYSDTLGDQMSSHRPLGMEMREPEIQLKLVLILSTDHSSSILMYWSVK
jgi:hypothetical protein